MEQSINKHKLKMVEEGCIDVPEAMRLMGIKSKATIYKLMDSGQLPYTQFGPRGLRRIPIKKIHELMARHLKMGEQVPTHV